MDATISVLDDAGNPTVYYGPYDYQQAFHASTTPNLLALGTRNTGKSLMLRMDAILRCLMIPNFKALILRRTMPELRESHLANVEYDMERLGGEEKGFVYLSTPAKCKFPNGSTITFRHCETEADILNFLSAEYGAIYFDELSTFSLTQFLQISAACRAPKTAGYKAVVRAGSNPLGFGAEWMEQWFVTKDVNYEDFPDYNPADFEMQFSKVDQNLSADVEAYTKRLKTLPEHVRRAWLLGEFVNDGAYFSDFHKTDETGKPWHVIPHLPTWNGQPLFAHTWLSVYRAIGWGYFPDPAVCLWIIVLPNKRAIVFKEKSWKRTLAADVAKDIKRESEGMHVVESFCDPTMNLKDGQLYSIGEIFEQNGVPVTACTNDRILYGYSVHELLNTQIDGLPQVQIVKPMGIYGCPDLIKTIPMLRMDKTDPRKLADGNDHWVVALAYFAMGQAPPSRNPVVSRIPRWMQPKPRARRY